jgi:hypothetical protein
MGDRMSILSALGRHGRRALGIAALGAALGCPQGYAVWLIEGSRSEHAMFGLATQRGGRTVKPLQHVTVSTCEQLTQDLLPTPGKVVWETRASDSDPPGHDRLIYGQTPVGHMVLVAPERLATGCYDVWAGALHGGMGGVTILVDSTGQVRLPTKQEKDSVDRLLKRHFEGEVSEQHHAKQVCDRSFRAARTAGDSARVDSLVPVDTARFSRIACREVREWY